MIREALIEDSTEHRINADGSDACEVPQYDVQCRACGRLAAHRAEPDEIAGEVEYHEARYHRHAAHGEGAGKKHGSFAVGRECVGCGHARHPALGCSQAAAITKETCCCDSHYGDLPSKWRAA